MNSRKIFTDKKYVLLAAVICSLLWGSAYPSIKIGYNLFKISSNDTASKLVFAGYRFTLAGIMVLVFYLMINKKLNGLSKANISQCFILGVFQTTLQYMFFYIGLANTTGVNGAILNSFSVFFSVILAHYIYKNDKINGFKIAGCFIGMIGIVILNLTKGFMNFTFNFYGDGFVIIAAIITSGASIYGKKLSNTINTVLLTGYQLLLGGLLLTILGFFCGGTLGNFSIQNTTLLIYMSFLSAAGFTLWTTLLKYNKVGRISSYNLLIPIFGAVLSAIFLGEKFFQFKNAAALALVCLGIYLVNKNNEICRNDL